MTIIQWEVIIEFWVSCGLLGAALGLLKIPFTPKFVIPVLIIIAGIGCVVLFLAGIK